VALVLEVARDLGSSTTRLAAATLACFIDSTTSFSSACERPSMSRLYAGRPALPIPNPLRPTTSLIAYETLRSRLISGIVSR
jgi:hypothetical protein